ncbi:MAG TPA: ribonuclease Y [Spirochaetota bacterium]|nr:ribonuclease Y [Spirochaetota bacterium]HOM39079.1 ribonuclease Y [Spirochaetota bacterium]HPQ49985.1 ribonuclease Y [Spirochaetota bacterium]
MDNLITSLLAGIFGIIIGYLIRYIYGVNSLRSSDLKAKNIIAEAERKKKEIEEYVNNQKELIKEERKKIEANKEDLYEKKKELQSIEVRLLKKEENLEKREENVNKRELDIISQERKIEEALKEIETKKNEIKKEIEKIAGITREEAKKILIEETKQEITKETYEIIKKKEEEIKEIADKKAKEIIVYAIQKIASEVTSETTISTVSLPSEEVKGRIIGREGRNIRALETVTGVDVIVDDTPEAIVLSSFDPIKREIARKSIEVLVADGRIQPSRIEEIVEKVKEEINEIIYSEGDNACYELEIHNMHPELKKYIGRLKFRTSYGQNVLAHSKEVARIASIIAVELGLDKEICKRAGLLHDIGKGVINEEKRHAITGAELAKRFGESEAVVNAILSHHDDAQPLTLEALVIHISDTISASRPGARRDTFENYIKRLENLQNIALSFPKVEKAYAIQAGREVRVIIDSETTNDEDAKILAREIVNRIEKELKYPGQIKVSVIRETRIVEYAK